MNDRLCDQTSISKLYKMRLMCLTESVEACKQWGIITTVLVEMGALSAFYLFQFDTPHHISRTEQHRITDAHAGVNSFPATATR